MCDPRSEEDNLVITAFDFFRLSSVGSPKDATVSKHATHLFGTMSRDVNKENLKDSLD